MFEGPQQEKATGGKPDNLIKAKELIEQLDAYPLAQEKLQTMIKSVEDDEGEVAEVELEEMMGRIQRIMEQRESMDPAYVHQAMEAYANGKDPQTGEPLAGPGTSQ